ncbi:MAG: hypothetical protein FJX63_06105 [Alphaproteobacteria bacterium]|nr:hypothetical protein [Alphaproteobacteria bacterium]
MKPSRIVIAVLIAYLGSYVAFRLANTEIWEKDNRPYVIFPSGAGVILYYTWRPVEYIDGWLTGIGFHIGPHQE